MVIYNPTQSELYLVRGRTGTGKTNKLLSIAIQHLLQGSEHNVLFLVTEATPLSIGQRLVRDYPSMDLPRIKVSDFHIGLTPVIPHPYTMLIIDDNGFKREVDVFVNKVSTQSPDIKVVRSMHIHMKNEVQCAVSL